MTARCQHLTRNIFYAQNATGSYELAICAIRYCADIKVICEHTQAQWLQVNSDYSWLCCNGCGRDCT